MKMHTYRIGLVLKLSTRIKEVFRSNLILDTRGFSLYFSARLDKCLSSTSIKPQPIPCISFPNHYSSLALPSETVCFMYWRYRGSRDSPVGIVTGRELQGPGLIPRIARFVFSLQRPNRLWGSPSLLSNGRWAQFPLSKAAKAWSWPLTSV
jgi:hypothetical protein